MNFLMALLKALGRTDVSESASILSVSYTHLDGVVKEVFIEDNMKVGLNDRIMVIE